MNDECQFDSVAMIKVAMDLFMRFFAQKYPLDVINFLLDQYILVSECDSDSNENEVFNFKI